MQMTASDFATEWREKQGFTGSNEKFDGERGSNAAAGAFRANRAGQMLDFCGAARRLIVLSRGTNVNRTAAEEF